MRIPGNTSFKIAALALAASSLCACVDTSLDMNTRQQPQVKAPPIPVALVSVEGAPEPFTNRFQTALATEAKLREIVLVQGTEEPRFKLRGYLSAYEVQGGTAVTWVWDVYDTNARRAQRINGSQVVKRTDAEPWNVVDDTLLRFAASSSMNEVAAYLGSAPPAASIKTAPKAPAPPAPGRPAAPGAAAVAFGANLPRHTLGFDAQ